MSESAKSEIVGIQYLRAIAATLVVISHVASMAEFPKYFGRSPGFGYVSGYIGVDLFFVISGFIIVFVSLAPQTLSPRIAFVEFMRRRLLRILPFMWLCVAAYLGLRLLARGPVEDFAPFVRAATLWPVGNTKPEMIWTLRHELVFYLVFGLCLLSGRRAWPLLLLWLLAPLPAAWAWPEIARGEPDLSLLAFFFSPLHLEFGIGAAIAVAYLRMPQLWRGRMPAQLLVLVALSALLTWTAARLELERMSVLNVLLLGSGAAVLLAVALRAGAARSWAGRVGHALGDASYAIYLTHPALVSALLGLWSRLQPQANMQLVLVGVTLASVGAGYLAHLLVEKPLLARVRGAFQAAPRGIVPAAQPAATIRAR
jgi:exopolysaccharide production protein ExoZ